MNEKIIDRKSVAFYLTLMVLVVLDFVLILWILSPFTSLGTSAYASQKVPAVSDASKPSPFDIAESRRAPMPASRRKSKPSVPVNGTR